MMCVARALLAVRTRTGDSKHRDLARGRAVTPQASEQSRTRSPRPYRQRHPRARHSTLVDSSVPASPPTPRHGTFHPNAWSMRWRTPAAMNIIVTHTRHGSPSAVSRIERHLEVFLSAVRCHTCRHTSSTTQARGATTDVGEAARDGTKDILDMRCRRARAGLLPAKSAHFCCEPYVGLESMRAPLTVVYQMAASPSVLAASHEASKA